MRSFNPHTHAGCDSDFLWCLVLSVYVSIHTPTQGVTQTPNNEYVLAYVSIHTPTQGVTKEPDTVRPGLFCFNPHTHAGCDSISNNIL